MAGTKVSEAPKQYSQPSRKGKKAWRKHVDVSDIQSGLELVRDEVIKGGVIVEKPSESLFALDITGSTAIKRSYLKAHKPLKADQILSQRSAVLAIDSRKRPAGVTDGVLINSKRRKGNGVTPQHYERLRALAYSRDAVPKDLLKTGEAPEYDPWEDVAEEGDPRFSYLEKPKPVRAPRTLKEPPISLLEGGKSLPAVPKPIGGHSYNPVFTDYDILLLSEGDKEISAEKKRLRGVKDEEELSARIKSAETEKDNNLTEDESAWEGIESEYEAMELKRKRSERKTPAERNKVKRRKEAERKAKHEAEMKKRMKQAETITEIIKEMKGKDAGISTAMVKSEQEGGADSEEVDDRALRRRKLGKAPVPERPLELVLPEELQDSLRLLRPEGNLLKDRFRSLLVRGKMETRKPIQQPKRAKRIYTEKWTYKDFTISA